MTHLALRLLAFSLIQATIGWYVLSAAISVPRPGFFGAMEDKLALIQQPGPPRTIFVGGSSVAFGIDSPTFVEGLHQPAVNLGLHAALTLDFYLRIVEQHGRPGDLVVVIPEYNQLLACYPIPPLQVRHLLRGCPRAFRYLGGNLPGLIDFADQMALSEFAHWSQQGLRIRWRHAKQKVKSTAMARSVRARWRGNETPQVESQPAIPPPPAPPESVYTRANFNQFGDMVGHHGRPSKELAAPPHEVQQRKRRLPTTVHRLNQFAAHCRARGITVIYSYSPVMQSDYERVHKALDDMHAYLKQNLQIPIVNVPSDTVFPDDQFFDTNQHLAERAKMARSRILLEGLQHSFLARQRPRDRWR